MPQSTRPPIGVVIVPVTPFQQNASIVWCTATRKAAIVDPGGDLDRIRAAISRTEVTPEKILLTHGHIDHAGGAAELAEALAVPIEGPHLADRFLLDELPASGARFDMAARSVAPTRWLAEGDIVTIGEAAFAVLEVPGHSPGSVCFVHAPARFALVGDTLFQGSVGRTDMGYGSHDELIAGIKTKLLPLGDDVTVLPGHGNPTTIGAERASNPFLRG